MKKEPPPIMSPTLRIDIPNLAFIRGTPVLGPVTNSALCLTSGPINNNIPVFGIRRAIWQPEGVVRILADFASDVGGAIIPLPPYALVSHVV
jgi:hypothetical protein